MLAGLFILDFFSRGFVNVGLPSVRLGKLIDVFPSIIRLGERDNSARLARKPNQ